MPKDENCEKIKSELKRIRTLVTTWLYGISKVGGEGDASTVAVIRQAQEEAIRRWLNSLGISLPKVKDALEACRYYVRLMDRTGLMSGRKFTFEKKAQRIFCRVKNPCIYGEICSALVDDGFEPMCLRTWPFVFAIREMTGKEYDSEAIKVVPSYECIIELWPVEKKD